MTVAVGDVGVAFFTGLLLGLLVAELVFAAAVGAGLTTADGLAIGFLVSFVISFFDSLDFSGFGDDLFGVDCLVDAVALMGVRGSGKSVFSEGLP